MQKKAIKNMLILVTIELNKTILKVIYFQMWIVRPLNKLPASDWLARCQVKHLACFSLAGEVLALTPCCALIGCRGVSSNTLLRAHWLARCQLSHPARLWLARRCENWHLALLSLAIRCCFDILDSYSALIGQNIEIMNRRLTIIPKH